jgi:hypothetical protein
MKRGHIINVVDPDFDSKQHLGFEGEIIDNPFLDICRRKSTSESRAVSKPSMNKHADSTGTPVTATISKNMAMPSVKSG